MIHRNAVFLKSTLIQKRENTFRIESVKDSVEIQELIKIRMKFSKVPQTRLIQSLASLRLKKSSWKR